MAATLLEFMESEFGFVPNSVKMVFTPKDYVGRLFEIFSDGLRQVIQNRSEKPLERYVGLARPILALMCIMKIESKNILKRLRFERKLHLLLGEVDNVFSMKYQNFYSHYSHKLAREISTIYSTIPSSVDLTPFIKYFEHKIAEGWHPLYSEVILKSLNQKLKVIAPAIIGIESVIHGIDDYVDERDANYVLDLGNVFYGILGLFFYLKEMLGWKTRFSNIVPRFIDECTKALFKLTEVPIVERETIGILHVRCEEGEMEIALKNIRTRTWGTTYALLTPLTFMVRKEELLSYAKVLQTYRSLVMLKKDIEDIDKDLRNGDYKPAAVWALKYGKDSGEFKKKVKELEEEILKDLPSSICVPWANVSEILLEIERLREVLEGLK